MASATWSFVDGRIGLRLIDGGLALPPAADIFRAAFRGQSVVLGYDVKSPLEDLPSFSFSRLPAETAVRVSGTIWDPSIEIGVLADSKFICVAAPSDAIVSEGRWFPVIAEELIEASQWLEQRRIRVNGSASIGMWIALRQAIDLPFTLVDELDTKPDESVLAGSFDAKLPALSSLRADLYPYQKTGVAFLMEIARHEIGCVLADEMGLGKTLQVIALIVSEKALRRAVNLVVAPATLLENWKREFQQFAPDLDVFVHAGAARPGVAARVLDYDVVIASYDTVVRDLPMMQEVSWNVVVLDEAQSIKNPTALRSVSVKSLKRRVSVAVTGTPLENHIRDLWSVCDFSLQGLLGDLEDFTREFENDVGGADRLSTIVSPILLRRRIVDVATELPELIEVPGPLRMTTRMAVAYESVRQQVLETYSQSASIVALTKLRQLCAHPVLLAEWDGDLAQEMPKYQRLLELLEEIESLRQKALIFCAYQEMTDLLVRDLGRRWPACFVGHIDGRVQVSKRQNMVDEFSSSVGYAILVLNPKAAGVGLNITAANHVIHYTPEWNPATTDQASRRAYRRRQQLPVAVHHLYFVDSVEEVMIGRMSDKRELARHAVRGHEGKTGVDEILAAIRISPISGSAELE